MTRASRENEKRLIFRGSSVHWPDEKAEAKSASNLGWEFARAAVRGERVHVLDGFLFHTSWQEGKQEGPYLDLFRANKCKAKAVLGGLGINGVEIARPVKDDLYTWQLCPLPEGFECNIRVAVQMARKARERFRQGDPAGWDLLRNAYREWPDARSMSQAVALAGVLPEKHDGYEDLLVGLKLCLTEYRDNLVRALYAVLCLAAENQQGITQDMGELAITQWVSEFFELKQALAVLSKRTPARYPRVDRAVSQFAEFLKEYNEQKDYLSEAKQTSAEEVTAVQGEAARVLEQLKTCDAVVDSACRTADYYEDLGHLRIRWEDVSNCLEGAIEDFSELVRNVGVDHGILYARFDEHLRRFVARSHRGQGIRDVLRSDLGSAEKKREFRQILENMLEEEEVRVRLRQFFDLAKQQSGQGHGATLVYGRLCPAGGPGYLQSIGDVLKIDDPKGSAQWFRKTGPTAADFGAGMVYRPVNARNELKDKLVNNPACVLEGDAATGKTVLLRDLMLELRDEIGDHIYYFSCHQPDGFDTSVLVAQIKSLEGIVVVEDIHLCPQKAQQIHSLLYSWLRTGQSNHLLFVGRSSFREGENARLAQKVSDLPVLLLIPSSDAGAIIQQYIEYQSVHTPNLMWPESVIRSIKARSGQNYWLLAYALDGYVKARGEGEPTSWIQTGVGEDLRDLTNCRDQYAAQYPEILVALSPLYKKEVMTAKEYLTDRFEFQPEALNALVTRGEVTREIASNGDVFYGLPHSSLADAYWEHGKEYAVRDMRHDDADRLYEYATFTVSNPLRAVFTGDEAVIQSCLSRIHNGSRLPEVIARESSLDAIADLAQCVGCSSGGLASFSFNVPALLDAIAAMPSTAFHKFHDYAAFFSAARGLPV